MIIVMTPRTPEHKRSQSPALALGQLACMHCCLLPGTISVVRLHRPSRDRSWILVLSERDVVVCGI